MYVPGSNGATLGMYQSHDGGATVEYDVIGAEVSAAMLFSAAGSDHDGSVVVGGLLGAGSSVDGGLTWHPLLGFGHILVTQDVKYEDKTNLYTLTGNFGGIGGVALSTNGANGTFVIKSIPDDLLFSSVAIRYGSVPTDETFYITAGSWGESQADKAEADNEGLRRISKALSVRKDGTLKVHTAAQAATAAASLAAGAEVGVEPTGPWGQVAKTSDGGATWELVYSDTTSGLYPNDIHCFNAATCAFVKDASNTPYSSVIVMTTDGGASWVEHTLGEAGSSLYRWVETKRPFPLSLTCFSLPASLSRHLVFFACAMTKCPHAECH